MLDEVLISGATYQSYDLLINQDYKPAETAHTTTTPKAAAGTLLHLKLPQAHYYT